MVLQGLVALVLLVFTAGCMTVPRTSGLVTRPVAPAQDEQVVLDQLLILVDVSGSMTGGKVRYEKALVNAFTGAMPDGNYEAGISSFAGKSSKEWVQIPLSPYNRQLINNGAASIVLLGSLTPLDRAISMLTSEMEGKGGNGALLVFSDGLVRNDQSVYDACDGMRAAHRGNFCIYTVQIGDRERGRQLLHGMAATTGCGQSWNGFEINSAAAIEQVVRTIFFGPKPVAPAPAPAPAKAEREIVLLGDILFDFDKDILKPAGKVEVDKVVVMLKNTPDDTALIEGHTCDLGTDAYNMNLSQRRANSVMNYMVSQGISAARLSTAAYGESRPAVPNTSEENRKLNRRVKIILR